MKKFLLLFLLASFSVQAQIVNIPDANFKAKLLEASPENQIAMNLQNQWFKIDANGDGEIQESEATQVKVLNVNNSNINSILGIVYFSNIYLLNCSFNMITELPSLTGFSNLNDIDISNNLLQEINITDFNCQNFNCSYNSIEHINISNSSFSGYFTCTDNYNLISLTLTNIFNTDSLNIYNNSLESVIIDNVEAQILALQNNQIEMVSINQLDCYGISLTNNQITELVLDNINSNFVELWINNNPIQSFTLSNSVINNENTGIFINNTSLSDFKIINSFVNYLDLRFNQIQNFELINSFVNKISLQNNSLVTIDISDLNKDLSPFITEFNSAFGTHISYESNPLEILLVKNGLKDYGDIFIPTLNYVCNDEFDVIDIGANTNYEVVVNSYCSFTPGGEFFTLQGNSKIDLPDNGCDENDLDFPNMKFNITNGSISGNIISNTSGDYSISVQEGTHMITPVFENPTYFIVSPPNVSAAFPTATSPFTQNFCITPNGSHQDVEVTIIPNGAAIPGFNSNYTIIYKNKGNTIVSGTIELTFQDNVLEFISSNPVQNTVEPNVITWNYSNLQPFETQTINASFNINSPQETPPVIEGENLAFSAIINPVSGDEMPSDNISRLIQTVVNSFDPNDKTCIEGSVVSSALIGQYVHYVIRFENTGTFFAQNVVVKDEIDLSKFDLNSLIVLSASHQQWTRINGNKVEFIFENIQLPFPPSEERYGYIAFKIKLKNNLAVGDTFSNFASIYFDYNFPIITEPATTSIEALSNPDFEFSSFVKLYPNPASSVVTIESQTINLKSVEIFNSLGQLIQANPNENNQLNIDVSGLQTGTYFVKVNSDKGVGVSKFVKQ